jgi:hypothetical protein
VRYAGGELIDDLDQDAPTVLRPAGLHHTTQRLCGATAAADDLAEIVLGHTELQHERAIVFLELAHLDLVGLVDQRLGEELEQLLQAMPFAFSRRLTVALG